MTERLVKVLQQCGSMQQCLKGWLGHHISASVSPLMWQKLRHVFISTRLLMPPWRGNHFSETSWLLGVKTQHSVAQDFSPRGSKKKERLRWCNIHRANAHIAQLRNFVAQALWKAVYLPYFCLNVFFHEVVSHLGRITVIMVSGCRIKAGGKLNKGHSDLTGWKCSLQ